jgi:hypothetical protein
MNGCFGFMNGVIFIEWQGTDRGMVCRNKKTSAFADVF